MKGNTTTAPVTVTELLSKMASEFCDFYCKYPERYATEDGDEDGRLYDEHCAECPFNLLGI